MSNVNGNMLMFRKTNDETMPYRDISPDLCDLEFFRYLISIS